MCSKAAYLTNFIQYLVFYYQFIKIEVFQAGNFRNEACFYNEPFAPNVFFVTINSTW